MQGHDLLWYLGVGLLTGWIASLLVQGKGMGIVRDMAVGIVGALLGGYMAGELGIYLGSFWSTMAMAVIGAVVFLVVLRAFVFSRSRR